METNNSLTSRSEWPYDLEVDGIYYKHLQGTDEIMVTSSAGYAYRGDFNIPRKVTYREREYKTTGIGEGAFYSSVIYSLEIPNTVTDIEADAFRDCRNLEIISIPQSVRKMGESLFLNCHQLESITVESENSFYMDIDGVLFTKDKKTLIAYPPGRKGAYSIPEGVTAIANYAFWNCLNLVNITIPDSILSIGHKAFNSCESLMEIRIDAPLPPTCGKNVFRYIPQECKLIVPESSKNAYRETDGWKDFLF